MLLFRSANGKLSSSPETEEERVTRMRHSFQTEVERVRQRNPKILAMRKKPEKRLTFYHIEEVKK